MAVVFGLLGGPAVALAKPPAPPYISAKAAMLVTADGVELWSKSPHSKRRVASCIKLLNALVVRDYANLDDEITVTNESERIFNGDVGLVTGQKLTVRQLLRIMLVKSANDAAEALAIGIAGSEKRYVKLMNAKAKELGLKYTVAADPHGLGKHEVSSSEDLSVLARQVLKDPVLREIVHHSSAVVPRVGGGSDTVGTTDRLLGVYPGMEGIKTGYTDPAGYCFVGAAKRGDVELVGVILGADSSSARFTEMRRLLDWGFAHTHVRTVVSRDETMAVVELANGAEPSVAALSAKPLATALLDGASYVTTAVVTPMNPNAPVVGGQKLGQVELVSEGTIVASAPLVAARSVSASIAPMVEAPAAKAPVASKSGFWASIAAWPTAAWRWITRSGG